MKSEVNEVIRRVEVAERVALRLRRTREESEIFAADDDELSWLATAEKRLIERTATVRAELEHGIALPEFKAVREERAGGLEQAWLGALRELYGDLAQHVGETSPLVEALFPHRKFEKLERGGTAQRQYRAQFAQRRASTYVRRMAADPDYAFLPPALERVDRATQALAEVAPAEELSEDDAQPLRDAILRSGDALALALRQARLLAEAALIDRPELFAELGFDDRPRKRAPQPAPLEQAVD